MGPEGLGIKNFEIWTRYELAARNENHGSIILCVAVLVWIAIRMGVLKKIMIKKEAT